MSESVAGKDGNGGPGPVPEHLRAEQFLVNNQDGSVVHTPLRALLDIHLLELLNAAKANAIPNRNALSNLLAPFIKRASPQMKLRLTSALSAFTENLRIEAVAAYERERRQHVTDGDEG